MRDPEAALIGESEHGGGFLREIRAHRVKVVRPAGSREVAENFISRRQMHKRSARPFLLEIPVAEFHEPWILFAAHPSLRLQPPEQTLGRGRVPVVSREYQRRAGDADIVELAERGPAMSASRDLHQPIEHEQRAAKAPGDRAVLPVRAIRAG